MITIPVSIGELIDKLSILHVKQTKITNEEKLEYVNKEFELLYIMSSVYLNQPEIETLYHSLVNINSKLWDIEDELRVLESEERFGNEFIELARKVYFTNDERFTLKNKINQITNSEIREVKDYIKYIYF
jgi:hypothetical protein